MSTIKNRLLHKKQIVMLFLPVFPSISLQGCRLGRASLGKSAGRYAPSKMPRQSRENLSAALGYTRAPAAARRGKAACGRKVTCPARGLSAGVAVRPASGGPPAPRAPPWPWPRCAGRSPLGGRVSGRQARGWPPVAQC